MITAGKGGYSSTETVSAILSLRLQGRLGAPVKTMGLAGGGGGGGGANYSWQMTCGNVLLNCNFYNLHIR